MKKIYTYIVMLMMAVVATTSLTSCEEEDDYIAQQLRGCDWQGYIDTYYQNRWHLSGDTYETVMRFESKSSYYTSGRGFEADYNVNSPYRDYAYCTFKWFIVDGEITLIYDDSKWDPIYINKYYINGNYFRGYINDGSGRTIRFELESITDYDGWSRYDNAGSYGDFWDQQYYRSRSFVLEEDNVPFLNRTDIARQESGESDAVSVASGAFAEAMQSK